VAQRLFQKPPVRKPIGNALLDNVELGATEFIVPGSLWIVARRRGGYGFR
jgi:hypothetical protein